MITIVGIDIERGVPYGCASAHRKQGGLAIGMHFTSFDTSFGLCNPARSKFNKYNFLMSSGHDINLAEHTDETKSHTPGQTDFEGDRRASAAQAVKRARLQRTSCSKG